MAYAFPPRTPQQIGANEANLDESIGSPFSVTGEAGVGGGGPLSASRILYLDFPSLGTLSAADPADYLVVYDSSTGTHKRVLVNSAVPGASTYKYVDNDCLITASGLGITTAKDTVNGIVTITVPSSVMLYSVNITCAQTDTDSSNNLYVKVIYESEATICQDLATVDVPHVTYVNTSYATANASVVSESFPAPYDPTKTISLITSELDGADAILQLRIDSIVDDTFIVKLTF